MVKQLVNDTGHIGDVDILIAINVGGIKYDVNVKSDQIINEYGDISNAQTAISINITRLYLFNSEDR